MSADDHGSASTYINHGCRCDECRAAHATRVAEQRKWRAEVAQGRIDIEHGTNSTYINHGCRCGMCREAHRVYRAAWQAKKKASA